MRSVLAVMTFVLSLFLLALGAWYTTVTHKVNQYMNIGGFNVVVGKKTVHPYREVGGWMIMIGVLCLATAFGLIMLGRTNENARKRIPGCTPSYPQPICMSAIM